MAWITGLKSKKIVIWTEQDYVAGIEHEMDRYRKEGYKDVTCWAVPPNFHNEHFAKQYPTANGIHKEE